MKMLPKIIDGKSLEITQENVYDAIKKKRSLCKTFVEKWWKF